MREFDRLPADLRIWLTSAVLPWGPRSVHRTYTKALARTESRGAHCRTDHPERDDRCWLNRTLATWPDGAAAPTLGYEPVGLLDLPPGDRGYGRTDRIPMGVSLQEYNATVSEAQRKAGALLPALEFASVYVNDAPNDPAGYVEVATIAHALDRDAVAAAALETLRRLPGQAGRAEELAQTLRREPAPLVARAESSTPPPAAPAEDR